MTIPDKTALRETCACRGGRPSIEADCVQEGRRSDMRTVMTCCAVVGVCSILVMAGCSHTFGSYVPNAQFAYPNSNIKPLGTVQAKVTKTGSPPVLTLEDVKKAYNDALSQAEGANILINYKEDTTWTSVPLPLFPSTVEYRIEGTAARMEVGTKALK